MLEIALGVARDPVASKAFQSHFISDGGDFEPMIEKHGFALTLMQPRLTPEKIEHIAKVDRGEKLTPAFTDAEMVQRIKNEATVLKRLAPVAVVTGSYASIPVVGISSARMLDLSKSKNTSLMFLLNISSSVVEDGVPATLAFTVTRAEASFVPPGPFAARV